MAGTAIKLITPSPIVEGKLFNSIVEWTGPASYTAGGEPFSLKEAGLGKEAIFAYSLTGWVKNLSNQVVYKPEEAWYDGEKVHFIDGATGLELAAGKDLHLVTVLFEVDCFAN